ncbi:tryptophan 2,3-dioxygenase family protein [Dyella tabacisoli]|uniref:Tryptophan 2,3-dioxygenase n=1 Tax=Dyella tabacisoli TaxID=2282381 RepID=A0A369UQ27_9GAMM|nr:tryptophan 2,3-dioxygenase family protein [Dyella tabacisoli]RDD80429.1 hypothetical protein DVJ77_17490 [Dyella tabacisoli]
MIVPAPSYAEYIQVPELLELQKLRTPVVRAELTFIVVHQVYELWFKLVLVELRIAIAALDKGATLDALRALRRAHDIENLMLGQAVLIERMDPCDFAMIRESLGSSSAAESTQFALIESLSTGQPGKGIGALEERDLWSALCECVRRTGLAMPLDASEHSARRRDDSLYEIYIGKEKTGEPRRDYEVLKDLCEAMLDHDQAFALWRQRHALMVYRQIGDHMGTGGTSGVSYLERRAGRKFFPDIWRVRNRLGRTADTVY